MGQKDATLGILTDKVGRLACSKCGEELDVSEYSIFEHVLCPVCQHEVSVPAKLGNFLLLGEIGKGGMGAVYLAKDESLGREVALKVMRQEYGNDPRFLDNLLKEAQAAAALNHPNVVQVYTFGQEMGQPYIVMELVHGGRLDLHIKNQTQVDELTVLDTALDVAKGLQAAAEAGLIHGDIKPANVLYDRQNRAKVVDFGLAKFEGGGKTKGEIWGTPYYIAPEKARGKSEDSRSDQYSLGATLYHALTGKPPFDGETAADVVVARLKQPPPDVRQLNPGVSEKTAALVLRMMDPTPARRYPTYPSLLADLQEARAALVAARQQQQLAAKGKIAAQKKGGMNPVWALAGLALLAAVVVGVMRAGRPSARPPNPGLTGTQANRPEPPRNFWATHTVNDVSPFSQRESAAMIDAMRLVTDALRKKEQPRSLGALSKLGPVLSKHAPETPGHAWVQLYQVMAHVLSGEAESARDLLRDVAAAKITYVGNPPEDPRILARMLGGQVEHAQVKANITQAADWYRQLVDFLAAFRMVMAGEPEPVAGLVQAYVAGAHAAYWPYAFQDYAALLADQAKEAQAILANPDAARKGADLTAFINRHPVWKNLARKAGGSVAATGGASRGNRSYIDVIRSLSPLVYYRLGDTAPGKLLPAVDSGQSATAVYVVADGLGKATTSLSTEEGFDEGNRMVSLAERNSFDVINNLAAAGRLGSQAGAVVFWFRTREKGEREMFFARGEEKDPPFRLRLNKDGRPEFSVGDGTPLFRIALEQTFNDGKWHQFAAVWNRGENRAELSVDGIKVSGRYNVPATAFQILRFGRGDRGGGQFKGDLDELALWDRALTPADFGLLTSR
jgi:hypothetical protein